MAFHASGLWGLRDGLRGVVCPRQAKRDPLFVRGRGVGLMKSGFEISAPGALTNL